MIVSCSSCMRRYHLDGEVLGSQGRQVRCTNCGYIWYQPPPPPPKLAVMAKSPPYYLPPSVVPFYERKGGGIKVRRLLWGLVGGAFCTAAIVLGLVVRQRMFVTEPKAQVFVTSDATSGDVVEIEGLSFRHSHEGVIVKGYLHNRSARALTIPPLILSFIRQTSAGGQVLYRFSHAFTDPVMKAGETRNFTIPCEGVPGNFSFIVGSFS